MKELNIEEISNLPTSIPPCITLYWAGTNHPSLHKDRLRFRGLLKSAAELLAKDLGESESQELLAPLRAIAERDEGNVLQGPVAFFHSKELSGYLRIPAQLEDSVFVADTFHFKPIHKWLSTHKRYLFLTLSRSKMQLFLGSMDTLTPIDQVKRPALSKMAKQALYDSPRLDPETMKKVDLKRLFLTAEKKFWPALRTETCPLILGGLPELRAAYIKTSSYPFVIEEGVYGNLEKKSLKELHALSAQVANTHFEKEQDKAIAHYREAHATQRATENLKEIAKAAVDGRISELLVSEETKLWGILNRQTGSLQFHPEQLNAHDDDVLDDLAEVVFRSRGHVWVVPERKMPLRAPAVAVLRW